MQGYFVIRTHQQRELYACENIVRQGGRPYLPKMAERVKVKGKGFVMRPKFLFPTYVFVDTDGQWRFLLSTYGVAEVLLVGKEPAILSLKEVARLKALEDDEGFIKLPPPPVIEKPLAIGDAVRVSEGLYSGYQGIYDGMASKDRERVLLNYLGRKTKVLIGAEALEKV